jgi:FHA domain-containing protein
LSVPFELTIAFGARSGRRFGFDAGEVTIGRGPENDLVLYHPGVSRSHACIRRQAQGYVLCDNGSSNGTELNGARVRGPAALRPGDLIGVGPVVFEFAEKLLPAAQKGDVFGRMRAFPRRAQFAGLTGGLCSVALAVAHGLLWPEGRGVVSFTETQDENASSIPNVRRPSATEKPADLRAARDAYQGGRRKLEERRVAPRNLYDAWKAFTTARRSLEGLSSRVPLHDELQQLIADAERDLEKECRRLLFAAARFHTYGQQDKAQSAYRDVLLHFPGDDPSGCRKKAQENVVSTSGSSP